ncbi:MAG: YeeE/YedE family protein [Oscillatoriales cyanobacterium C42_A2020_001]|nr:YeeE/YedE family protein [Leptolyngbyaceae cyanobacterium C42_A2020_001]
MDSISESLSTTQAFTQRLRPQRLIIAITLFLLTVGAIALSQYGWKHSVLFLVGGLLGVTLYHSSFGFASAYRKLFVQREVRGMYAQLVMLAVATILFATVLASGSAWGQPVRGAVSPIGVQGAIGALLFGIGMQLGGACGCGTLYTIGGGSYTMLLTLLTFCMGAFGASLTRQLWADLPAHPPIVLGTAIGWVGAVIVQLMGFGLLGLVLRWWSQRSPSPHPPISPSPVSLFHGPWSLLAGAIALAVLNWFTLILSGQPWRITWGFALWAAQVATWLGWDSTSSPFWSSKASQAVLSQGIFADVSSVMNIGIILGAVLAAALAGRFVPKGQPTTRLVLSTLLGGLIMGYGAFLAYGCNVSAFFGGIASTSVHGWVWITFALLGTLIGLRFRPLFRLD